MICRTEGFFWDESAEKRAFGPLFYLVDWFPN
ncbi:hypothetical protein ROSMUCSMR3_00769 [Roseovarius mucosus]|uniref:Uncharacterized protein n=1 Tax=Roseovarius mucosus TaxID=215743 RepID=A0A1V0RKH1_9RHOB|nr:hypothetical protein ROSMUCSMR3_00769 [Roseovarius mucosus]